MSTEQLTREALALPLPDRVALAQALWESIDGGDSGSSADDEQAAIALALQRDAELQSGAVAGREHQDVMAAARKLVECD